MKLGQIARRPESMQVGIALFALLVGTLTYLLGRSVQAYFVPDSLFSDGTLAALFSPIGNHLPTFAHTLAFTLLTTAVVWPWPRYLAASCVAWFTVELLMELGQHDAVAAHLAAAMPNVFHDVAVLEAIPRYFLYGTFDPLDLLSITLGSVCAWLSVMGIRKQGGKQ